MRWLRLLRKFQARSWADRRRLLQALFWLGVLRAAILLLPFRWIVAWIGLKPGEAPGVLNAAQTAEAQRIGWAVRAAAVRTPWTSACLAQALAGAILLHRQHLPATLYLGVAKDLADSRQMLAHAWLQSGGAILTGAAGHQRFKPISAFARF